MSLCFGGGAKGITLTSSLGQRWLDDLYNPTMDVLISGVLTDRATEDQKSNYIGRKLKAGDRLCLIVSNTSSGSVGIMFETSMSILD